RLSKTIGFGRETKGGSGGGGDRGYGGPRGHGGGLGPGGLSGAGGNRPFGGPRGGASRRYNLTFSISARNLLNTFNPGPPVGNLSSRYFGQSIVVAGGPFGSESANRRLDLQVRFSF
ncbi:MAG TPA: carboxypeptidase regulatory-like domain-containing protein, partial [Terriglobales bacterium]|nr:carboxypeptidase regulatory-like domain-containing protein [Terriglobales bacterium]